MYLKNPDEINRKLYEQQRNKCAFIRKKSIKNYFSNIISNGIITNIFFWKAIKPFLTNKGCLENSVMTLTLLIGLVVLTLKKQNLMLDQTKKNGVLSSILDKCKNHTSIEEIHLQSNSISISSSSWDSKVTLNEIKTILKFLNSKNVPGIDKIPTKLVNFS